METANWVEILSGRDFERWRFRLVGTFHWMEISSRWTVRVGYSSGGLRVGGEFERWRFRWRF